MNNTNSNSKSNPNSSPKSSSKSNPNSSPKSNPNSSPDSNSNANNDSNEPSSQPITMPADCPDCKKNCAYIKILEVSVPNEPPTVLTSLTCNECGKFESDYHDGDIGDGTGIKIKCAFKTHEDLKRNIRLPKMSSVKFVKDDYEIEITVGKTVITLVEEVIRKIVDNLVGVFDLPIPKKCDKNNMHDHKDDDSNVEYSEVGGYKGNINKLTEKEEAQKNVRFLMGLLCNPDIGFIMEIVDNTGIARIAPRGKLMKDVTDESEYNDGIVMHEFFEVENF